MQFFVIGINHMTAPLAVREQFSISSGNLPALLALLGSYVQEGFILSTCNRTEIYGIVPDEESGRQGLAQFLARAGDAGEDILSSSTYTFGGAAAVEHLFEVAAGLNSLVLGEDQILVQLKEALERAAAACISGGAISRLGQCALQCGKLVRTRTAINRQHLSVVSAGLHLACDQIGSLERCTVAVIGAGRMAELALKHVHGTAQQVVIVNRTPSTAAALAQRFGVSAAPFADLEQVLAAADIVIGCTSAAHTVIERSSVERIMADRQTRPLFLLDLAVPRDIEESCAGIQGVRLADVDSLNEICAANRRLRASEIQAAKDIVRAEANQFIKWWHSRSVASTIRSLRSHADTIRDAELERALARMPELSEYERTVMKHMACRIVNSLLHKPVVNLKQMPDSTAAGALVQQLFGLDDACS